MRFRFITIITILFSILAIKSNAQSYTEYEVKLVYLYQFVKYFNWPEENSNKEEFTIGLYGYYDFGDLPEQMYANRKFNNKSCKIISISSPEDAKSCDLIYVLGVSKFDAMQFLKEIKDEPILTVGDNLEDFCEVGGMVNFTDKNDKKRLELCPTNVENAKIQVSKQLYSIARIIDLDVDEF